MSKKSTIKNDPFATVIPDLANQEEDTVAAPARGTTAEPKRPAPAKKEKLTVHLTHDLIERVKNAAYWNPRLTIAGIAELGIALAIEQVERDHGGPYPPREAELKGGRPIGSTSAGKIPGTP